MIKIYVILSFYLTSINIYSQYTISKTLLLMGSTFEIIVVDNDSSFAKNQLDIAVNEISRIEKLISSWDSNSQTSEINRNSGIKPVKVDEELFLLIERSKNISTLTDGAFDISYASMDNIWKFDGSVKEMPNKEIIQKSISKIGYKNIILDKENFTVFLKIEGMKIGFGAVGKGYAADKTRSLLMKNGIKSGIINASGDMSTWGYQANNKPWEIAITNPFNKNSAFALLPIIEKSIVTSGTYEKIININGKKYSHIINPKTGMPAEGIVSVTIITNSAELADALATSVLVLGVELGLDRINQLPNVDCIIIDEQGKIHKSKNIKINGI